MAKKKSNRVSHLFTKRKQSSNKLLTSIKRSKVASKTLITHVLESQGYVRIQVETERDNAGNVCSLNMIKANRKSPNSIGLFIAGGKVIDDKVARANATLRAKGE